MASRPDQVQSGITRPLVWGFSETLTRQFARNEIGFRVVVVTLRHESNALLDTYSLIPLETLNLKF